MHNKDIQCRLEKLSQEEAETDDCLRECGEDAQQSDALFEDMISLMKESEIGLKKSISVEDFVHLDTEVQYSMISPAAMITNLQYYKTLFAKRREVLNKKLQDIRKERKLLLEEKQNLYCLTAVIIHDGTAESGHYFCFVLDKQSKKWIKCNDRTTTVVEFEEVYKTATGKMGSTKNVSGLVYEEQSWLEGAEK
jgi:ubiquitin carboxyl-terminal hydrolase 25